jgi:hypothetical protein
MPCIIVIVIIIIIIIIIIIHVHVLSRGMNRCGLLSKDPESRATATEALRHPFFAAIDWGKLQAKAYSAPVVPTIR